MSGSIYAMVLVAGFGMASLPGAIMWAVLVAVGIERIFFSRKFLELNSGFKQALDYLQSRGNGLHLSFCRPISEYYAGKEKVIGFESLSGVQQLTEALGRGYGQLLYLKTMHRNGFGLGLPQDLNRALEKILSERKPVFSVPLGTDAFYPYYCDETNRDEPEMFEPNLIEIYDLEKENFSGA